jgi:hypothetical protein
MIRCRVMNQSAPAARLHIRSVETPVQADANPSGAETTATSQKSERNEYRNPEPKDFVGEFVKVRK